MKDNKTLTNILSWVVTLIVPVALALTGVRLMMTNTFLNVEYNLPGFPPDPYGFTTQDRLHWSRIAMDYLTNPEGISFLGDLRFPDGTPLYNERELEHMVDVKIAIGGTLTIWYLSLIGLALLAMWAWRSGWMDAYLGGMSRGGFLTALLVGAIIAFAVLSFRVLFVYFHNIFFEAGTWMFYYSDTLIRLFPERFWQDIFIYVGSIALVSGLVLGFGLWRKRKPK